MKSNSINFNNKCQAINVIRTNVSKTNKPDTNYLNLTVGKASLINILLKRGWRLTVEFTQYLTKEDKKKNRPHYSITKEICGLEQLGIRTTTKAGKKFYRYKLEEVEVEVKDISKKIFKVGSICTGLASVATSIKDLGVDFDFEYSCEIEKHPKNTVKHNFDVKKDYDDVFNIDPKELDYVDVLSAGFVCTTFSLAGKLEGLNVKQGRIIFKIRDIVQELIELNKAPKVIFLENVAHIARHDAKKGEYDSLYTHDYDNKIGHSLHTIENTALKQLESHYDITWSIDNTLNYGVSHNRKRWFCVLTLKNSHFDFDFSKVQEKRVPLTTCLKDYLDPEDKVDSSCYIDKKFIPETYANKYHLERVGSVEGVSYSQSKRVLGVNKSASCLTCGENSKYLINGKVRTLTVNEKMKLQSIPKWYKFPNSVPKTARHKMLGNTMSINIVKVIFEVLFDKNNFKTPVITNTDNPINNINYNNQSEVA